MSESGPKARRGERKEREKLTVEKVNSFTSEGREQDFLFDTESPWLAVRATRSGHLAYVFESKLHGKTVRITIGSPKTWPLETKWRVQSGERVEHIRGARQEANRLKSLVDQGIDPRQHRIDAQKKVEIDTASRRREEVRFEEAWDVYVAENQSNWGKDHLEDHLASVHTGGLKKKRGKGKTVPGVMACFLPVRLVDITSDFVLEWIEREKAKRPTSVGNAYRLLRAFVNWADDKDEYRDLIPFIPARAKRVRNAVPPRNTKREDVLHREQLGVWFSAALSHPNLLMSTYLLCLVLTGARREEFAGLAWADVDFRWNKLKLKDKVQPHRFIPLTPFLRSRLLLLKTLNETPPTEKQMRRLERAGRPWSPSPWVFSSATSASGHMENPEKVHRAIIAAAETPHVTKHGLRRTFKNAGDWVEAPSGVIAQIMGHSPSALVEKHYTFREVDYLRVWHEKIEAWILEQAGIQFDAGSCVKE